MRGPVTYDTRYRYQIKQHKFRLIHVKGWRDGNRTISADREDK